MARLAYAYAFLLLTLDVLLIACSLWLNVIVFVGVNGPYMNYSVIFRAQAFVSFLSMAFVRDSDWVRQLKSCPAWIWKTGFALGVYCLTLFPLLIIAPGGRPLIDPAFPFAAYPLAFGVISFCVLYSVLWRAYLDKRELAKRFVASLLMLAFMISTQLAYDAGYLRHGPPGRP